MVYTCLETSGSIPAARHIPGGKDCQRERSKASPFVFLAPRISPGLNLHWEALPPKPSGIFRFAAKAGCFKMRSAVTGGKALLGSNLSAGDGPKLAGVAFGLPLPVFPLSTWPRCIGSIRRLHSEGKLSSPVPVPVRFWVWSSLGRGLILPFGGMHKGGFSGAVLNPLLWGEARLFAPWGEPARPGVPPEGGMRKGAIQVFFNRPEGFPFFFCSVVRVAAPHPRSPKAP